MTSLFPGKISWGGKRDYTKYWGLCFEVGPDLSTLKHSAFYSLVRNIAKPNASISPDAVAYQVTLKDGNEIVGTRLGETAVELKIGQAGGIVTKLRKADIVRTEPMSVSLMPEGLWDALSKEERRDLLTYLLFDKAPGAETKR